MPWEVVHHVFSFLSCKELCMLALVSYDWFLISCDNTHWKRLFEQDMTSWQTYVNPSKCRLSSWQRLSNMTSDITSNIATHVSDILTSNSLFNTIISSNSNNTAQLIPKNRVVKQLRKNHKWKSFYINEYAENTCCKRASTSEPKRPVQPTGVSSGGEHRVPEKKGVLPTLNIPWKIPVPFAKKVYRYVLTRDALYIYYL